MQAECNKEGPYLEPAGQTGWRGVARRGGLGEAVSELHFEIRLVISDWPAGLPERMSYKYCKYLHRPAKTDADPEGHQTSNPRILALTYRTAGSYKIFCNTYVRGAVVPLVFSHQNYT